jgi:hypothetical protein
MHGVRRSLLETQADALGLPVHVVELPWPCASDVYEERMSNAVAAAPALGVKAMVFGDLFLEDVRRYREQSLVDSGPRPNFQPWHYPTAAVKTDRLLVGSRTRMDGPLDHPDERNITIRVRMDVIWKEPIGRSFVMSRR